MAKKGYSRMTKIQPSVQRLYFDTSQVSPYFSPSAPASARWYLDLSQVASIVNRRFYRQGLNWAVAGIKIYASGSGSVSANRLPNTWVMSNAWEKGFRAWKKQQDIAIEENESVKAKYNDFKVFMSEDHLLADRAGLGELIPIDSKFNLFQRGEWDRSQIVIPNFVTVGTNYEPFIQAVGDDVGGVGGSISLIKAYADSRSVPHSPDPVVPADVIGPENIYRAMFDTGMNMEDVMENVVGKNDDLPYPQIDYPGGDTNAPGLQIHDIGNISATTIGGMTTLNGGNFPCGLIEFTSGLQTPLLIEVSLVPGNHRGYLCEPMTDM